MKKLFKTLLVGGVALMLGLGLGLHNDFGSVKADDEIAESAATVTIGEVNHGTVECDIKEGVAGDICTLQVNPDMFYIVESVSVNGVNLVESEEIHGQYSFALVAGENVVSVKIVVDADMLGELSVIFEEAKNKDWTSLFSLENIIIIVKWALDCGILVVVIRYFVKDKKLASKIENGVKDMLAKLLPDMVKETVLASIKEVLAPMFSELKADNVETSKAMGVFAKCLALAQQDTPEARTAIINELSNLKISDEKTLAEIKVYIDELVKQSLKDYNDTMASIKEIKQVSEEILNNNKPEEKEDDTVKEEKPYDGTSI